MIFKIKKKEIKKIKYMILIKIKKYMKVILKILRKKEKELKPAQNINMKEIFIMI